MINSPNEARLVLGIGPNATMDDVRQAYKRLVKLYHPDAGPSANREYYFRVREAYEYLSCNPDTLGAATPSPKIIGSPSLSRSRASDYSSFNSKYEKQQEAKKQLFEEKLKRQQAEQKRQEEEYLKAMEAINEIRLAEAIRAMIKNK